MTTYYYQVDPAFEYIRHQILKECNDLIIATADYLELFYRIFKQTPIIPNLTWKWISHFVPRSHYCGFPISPAIIIDTALFTVYVRLRFHYAPRDFFFYPATVSQTFSQEQVEEEMEGMRLE